MNEEELRNTIEQIKAQVKAKPENEGKSEDEIDEEILDGFFKAYTEGKMEKDDLEAIAGIMGYEFTDEFEADETNPMEDFAPKGEEEKGEGEEGLAGATKEELEDTRTMKPGESEEQFKEKIDEVKGEEEKPEEEGEEENEEDERKRASNLWKMNLNK